MIVRFEPAQNAADIVVTYPLYPPDWPRCPSCGDHALDGHATCGRVECGEAAHR